MEKKRILIVSCTSFYGGGEVFIKRIIPYLRKYHVYVYLKSSKLNLEIGESTTFFFPDNTFLEDIKHVNEIIKEHHISLVILNGNRSIYLAPFLPLDIKIIAYKHTGSASVPRRKKYIYWILNSLCLLRCNQIVCVSEAIANDIPFFKKKKKVVYNGLPMKCFPESLENEQEIFADLGVLRIVFVGRIERTKGVWEAVKAVEKCGARYRLYLLGEGEEFENIRCYLKERKVANVIMLGQVDNVGSFLRKSHVFILPSYYEAFGFSIIEAMAYSLPIISTNVGAIPEIVRHNIDGLLVTPRDIASLYSAIMYLSNNNEVRSIMGKSARERIKNSFMLDSLIIKVQEIIEENL